MPINRSCKFTSCRNTSSESKPICDRTFIFLSNIRFHPSFHKVSKQLCRDSRHKIRSSKQRNRIWRYPGRMTTSKSSSHEDDRFEIYGYRVRCESCARASTSLVTVCGWRERRTSRAIDPFYFQPEATRSTSPRANLPIHEYAPDAPPLLRNPSPKSPFIFPDRIEINNRKSVWSFLRHLAFL